MKRFICFFYLSFLFFSCANNKEGLRITDKNAEIAVVDLENISAEKQELVKQIVTLQKDLEDRRIEKIPDYLDSPKRIEEIELNTNNSKIRNAVESSQSRLGTDFIKDQFDLLYTEMDLNIINEALKMIPQEELLMKDEVSTLVPINNCEYQTSVQTTDKEVKFNIKSVNQLEECKKDQQWKFISNGEYLVLDRRYYL